MGQGHDHDGIVAGLLAETERRARLAAGFCQHAEADAAAWKDAWQAEHDRRVAAEAALDLLRRRISRMSEASDVVAVDPAHPRGTIYVSDSGERQLVEWSDEAGAEVWTPLAPVPGTRAALAQEKAA